jgi:hypothetical protein
MPILINKLKLIAAVLLIVGAFILGAKLGSTHTTETVTKEVKGETVTVFKDRVITVTKIVRPDGTTEETTKTEEKDKTKTKKETKKDSGTVVVYKIPKYSLGYVARVRLLPEEDNILPRPTISHGVTGGYHIGYNVWLKAGAIPSDKIYTLGVELQF